MVTDLIKIPSIKNFVFRDHLRAYPESILNITSHNIILTYKQSNGETKELWIFYTNLDAVEPTFAIREDRKPSYYTIVVHLKTLQTFYFDLADLDEAQKLTESLDALINYTDGLTCDVTYLYPFGYSREFAIIQDGWTSFSIEEEFCRLKTISDEWRISDVNANFAICESYPQRLIVPKSITDECLKFSAQFRFHGRFPLLSYLHRTSGSCLIRSAQPLVGPENSRSKEDEALVNAMLGQRHKKGWLFDTRHPSIVKSAQSRGGGCESEDHYVLWKYLHRHLEKNIILQDSFMKFMEACTDRSEGDRWLAKLNSSSWLSHVKEALTTACIVAQIIDCEETSVLIHGSDGWDTTLLVTSLTQILLDPNCRTIIGFENLIEREWIQGGHPFRLRCTRSAFGRSSHGQESPLFTLFLDCAWQLSQQFACSFEFNEKFLIELFEHVFSSRFGTFIFNNEKERFKYNAPTKTVSLWSYFNRPEILRTYLNPFYEPNLTVLWASVAPQSVVLWRSLYLRFYESQAAQQEAWNEYITIKDRELQLRSYVNRLRQELLELERKCVEKNGNPRIQ